MNPELLVFGDCNIDILGTLDEMPPLGGCGFGKDPSIYCGGSALNTAIAARRLGVRTALVSKIGTDRFGDLIMDALAANDLDTRHVVRTGEYPTGIAIVTVVRGERTFFSFRKNAADIHIVAADLADVDDRCAYAFVAGTVLFEGAESFDAVADRIEDLRKKGTRVFFDPNIRVDASAFRPRIERMLSLTDVLLPGENELVQLAGPGDPSACAARILDDGVSEIWMKKGENGSELFTRDGHLEFPRARVHAVDTTGAGDAYDGCVLWALLRGCTRSKTGRYANAYAGMTTEKIGAGEVYPNLGQFRTSPQFLEIEEGERND